MKKFKATGFTKIYYEWEIDIEASTKEGAQSIAETFWPDEKHFTITKDELLDEDYDLVEVKDET